MLIVFWRALKFMWEELFLMSLAGITWMLLGLGGIILTPFTLGLSLLPLVPLTAGLFFLTNQIAHGNAINFQMLFVGAWKYISRSFLWGTVNWLIILIVWVDLSYYGQFSSNMGTAAVTLAALLALSWMIWQILTLACLIEGGPFTLRAAYRKAWLLMISQPVFVLALIVISGLLTIICAYAPVVTGYAVGYIALAANVLILSIGKNRSGQQKRSEQRDPRM